MRSAKYLLAGLLVAGVPSLAHAQWYAGVAVGANTVQNANVTGAARNLDTKYNWGTADVAKVGYSFGAPKIELEGAYRDVMAKKVGGLDAGGDLGVVSLMVNGVYDFMPNSTIHPYVGAGFGGAFIDASNITQGGNGLYGGKDNQFAYQGFAGVGYDVLPNMMVSLEYRYFSTLDPNYSLGNTKLTGEYHNHAILVGMTYRFGAPAPQVAEAEPAPAPAPVKVAPRAAPAVKPVPAPHNYMVFFDFNKSKVNPQASRIIAEAAHAARTGHVARMTVTGHTDTVGTAKYNMALSVRRADAVKAVLIKDGVPANEIVVVGKGKSDPLVPTGDGVREPQNRRVEIVLH